MENLDAVVARVGHQEVAAIEAETKWILKVTCSACFGSISCTRRGTRLPLGAGLVTRTTPSLTPLRPIVLTSDVSIRPGCCLRTWILTAYRCAVPQVCSARRLEGEERKQKQPRRHNQRRSEGLTYRWLCVQETKTLPVRASTASPRGSSPMLPAPLWVEY